MFPDAVYDTGITCRTFVPDVEVEMCFNLTNAIRSNPYVCPLPAYPGPFTYASDISCHHLKIWKNPAPIGSKPAFYVVQTLLPIDNVGGNVLDWAMDFHESDAYCWSNAYFAHFGNPAVQRGIAAPCLEPVGTR